MAKCNQLTPLPHKGLKLHVNSLHITLVSALYILHNCRKDISAYISQSVAQQQTILKHFQCLEIKCVLILIHVCTSCHKVCTEFLQLVFSTLNRLLKMKCYA